jgi:hypothetical protein
MQVSNMSFVKFVHEECGIERIDAYDLIRLSSQHRDNCTAQCNEGETPFRLKQQEYIENAITNIVKRAAANVKGVQFHYDPRGYTVELMLVSGKSNSFTGGWIVPVIR